MSANSHGVIDKSLYCMEQCVHSSALLAKAQPILFPIINTRTICHLALLSQLRQESGDRDTIASIYIVNVPYSRLFSWGANFRYFHG